MTQKILITGPESSGKTTLAKQLAQHFACSWQAEYAREYLSALDRVYNRIDLNLILQEQTSRQTAAIQDLQAPFLICDTGPEVIYIWSKIKYGQVDSFIIQQLEQQQFDLRLLCYPDLQWEADPLREAPGQDDRLMLWQEYVALHERYNWDYQIIQGTGDLRLNTAIETIASQLSLSHQ